MTKPELKIFVEYLAEKNKCTTRSQKISNLLLPEDNFIIEMNAYMEHIANDTYASDVK